MDAVIRKISRPEFQRAFSQLQTGQKQRIWEMLRVNQAGETGANTIYRGQHDVLGRTGDKQLGQLLQHMWDQEKEHLRVLDEFVPAFQTRPSVLLPVWQTAGYVLGAGTAMLGKEAAMACTEAVEEVIGGHYNDQLRELSEMEIPEDVKAPLMQTFSKFRDEELEHFNTSLEHDAQKVQGEIYLCEY